MLKNSWTTTRDGKTYRFIPCGNRTNFCGRACTVVDVDRIGDDGALLGSGNLFVGVRASRRTIEHQFFQPYEPPAPNSYNELLMRSWQWLLPAVQTPRA